MKWNFQFLPTILFTGFIFILISCQEEKSKTVVFNEDSLQATLASPKATLFTIDTFSTFPPEIDGCSCYFSGDSLDFKKGIFIYMNDFDKISFLKINGMLTKFIQTEETKIDSLTSVKKASSDNYEMTIEIKEGISNGDETWLNIGTIKLSDKKGNTITKNFYGECGC